MLNEIFNILKDNDELGIRPKVYLDQSIYYDYNIGGDTLAISYNKKDNKIYLYFRSKKNIKGYLYLLNDLGFYHKKNLLICDMNEESANSIATILSEALFRVSKQKNHMISSSKSHRIFAFWQSESEMPGYLQLCIQTWYKCIDNLEVHFVNHSNIEEYLGDTYSLDQIKKLPYAQQSDAVSVALLERYGGLFLDVDTIMTQNIFSFFEEYDENKLLAFGYPPNRGIHIAILYAGKPNNPLLKEWRVQIQKKLKNIPLQVKWDYVGNSIIDLLLNDKRYGDYFKLIDCTNVGNILETSIIKEKDPISRYHKLYFEKQENIDILNILNFVKFGIISLHNSWTPQNIKSLSSDEFCKKNIFLVDLLQYILHSEEFHSTNTFFSYIMKETRELATFKEGVIWSSSLYFLDFYEENCHIAFDCVKDKNTFHIDLILRNNIALRKLKAVCNNKKKIRLYTTHDLQSLLKKLKELIIFYRAIIRNQFGWPEIKIYANKSVYFDIEIDSHVLAFSLNTKSNMLYIYFRDNHSLEAISTIVNDFGGFDITNNSYTKSLKKLSCDQKVKLFSEVYSYFCSIYMPKNNKVADHNHVIERENNNIIFSGDDYLTCSVNFKGKNNKLIIGEECSFTTLKIDFLGSNSTIRIGSKVKMSGHLRIGFNCSITIGNKTTSTSNVYMSAAEGTSISIGEDCMFATGNQVRTDDAHPIYSSKTGIRLNKSKSVVIGDHVWIGYNAVILSGSSIKKGSVVGMGSIVKGNFPNNCVIAGIPAKVIKKDIFWERTYLPSSLVEKELSQDEMDFNSYCDVTSELT